MTRKTRKIPKSARLKALAWKLIDCLERAVDQDSAAPDNTEGDRQAHHERLFGSKNSLTGTLVTLTDLILKLEHAEHMQSPADMLLPHASSEMMTPADIALVSSFLQRNLRIENPASSDN